MERKGKGSFPCTYFARDGYCAKGKFCEFTHDKLAPCKNYASAEGCRFGANCLFKHGKKMTGPVLPAPISAGMRAAREEALVNASKESKETEDKEEQASGVASSDIASVWGFQGASEDSVYFYGAAGGVPKVPNVNQEHVKKYSDAVGKKTAKDDIAPSNETSGRKVCTFFKAGYCMYGSRCMNLHLEGEDTGLVADATQLSANSECGICMSPPANGVFGIASNCNCVFCMDCIRSWRKEGLSFEHSEQVRMCPLCRVPSYYIVPSRVVPTPVQKEILLKAHRDALAVIPCKVHFTCFMSYLLLISLVIHLC